MPTYAFRNKETGELFDQSMKMAELDGFLEQNPTLERYHDGIAAPIGDPVRLGIRKLDGGMKEVLQRIKSANRRSTIRY